MQNSLSDYIEKVRRMFPSSSAFDDTDFEAVERALDIVLPSDFIKINKLVRYDILLSEELLDFSADCEDWSGVIKNNLKLRETYSSDCRMRNKVSKILLLSFEEYGCIFMITQSSREEKTPVVACSYYDMKNYFKYAGFKEDHNEWPSFTDFFEYLVEQEEKKLKEDTE